MSGSIEDAPTPGGHAIVTFTDVGDPWAHVVLHHLRRVRRESGITGELSLDLRALPLSAFDADDRAWTPGADLRAARDLAPDAGWASSSRALPDGCEHDVTFAHEAIQAAKAQGPAAADALDRGLREAHFRARTCISSRRNVFEVARASGLIDVGELEQEIASGRPRSDVEAQLDDARSRGFGPEPHVVTPDGSCFETPGIELRRGEDVEVSRWDPSVYDRILDITLKAQRFD